MSKNFGELLDDVLIYLNIKQIDLSDIFNIPKASVSADRSFAPSTRRIKKYVDFINHYGINREYLLGKSESITLESNTPRYIDDGTLSDDLTNNNVNGDEWIPKEYDEAFIKRTLLENRHAQLNSEIRSKELDMKHLSEKIKSLEKERDELFEKLTNGTWWQE